jgi:uncharacterized membrane protein
VKRDRRDLHLMVLAHHRLEDRDRCLHLPLGARRLALCARCVGLYPTILAALLVQAIARPPILAAVDWWLCLSGIFPALLDWGLTWLGRRRGTNRMRVATGVLLGISLGRGIWLYLHDLKSEVFWVQIGLLAVSALAFELVRRLRL